MALTPGARLGSYEIVSALGKGGMGEVWRARDSKLGREVAIKTLPEEFAEDQERVARFEREAKLLASLNHPNIAAIYGLEEDNGKRFLVLELVEGDTLAEFLAAGPLPVESALNIALQVAEGFDAAHQKGIIHRDLKPANIKVTPNGGVKVLDFGLAKAIGGETERSDLSTQTVLETREGTIQGTPAYMSPQQARGEVVDKRTDIWAFGCVLYEMLTGRRAFPGERLTDTVARILERDADWEALPESIPPKILDLVRRCLRKDVDRRLRDIGDARIEIEDALSAPILVPDPAASTTSFAGRHAISVVLAASLVAASIGVVVTWKLINPEPSPVRRLEIGLPPDTELGIGIRRHIAISPGGTHVAYTAHPPGAPGQLYLRALNEPEGKPIPDTNGARMPFFSPDGHRVGYFADDQLKTVSIDGGIPQTLSEGHVDANDARRPIGASWGDDGTIVIGQTGLGLLRVPQRGGTSQPITSPVRSAGEGGHQWPQILPGGNHVLFTATGAGGRGVVESLETGDRKVLVDRASLGRYLPTGHLVYLQAGTLMAVPFDLARLESRGDPVRVLEDIGLVGSSLARAAFSISNDGSLVYVAGQGQTNRRLVWVDQDGNPVPVQGAPLDAYFHPRLSPDGQRIVYSSRGQVRVYDLLREIPDQLTFEGGDLPIWTRNGETVTFRSNRTGTAAIWLKPANKSGPAEQLTAGAYGRIPHSWASDHLLAFSELDTSGDPHIWTLTIGNEDQQAPLPNAPSGETAAAFSPDGRWLAFSSDRAGDANTGSPLQVYVRGFPDGVDVPVSAGGGDEPMWSRDGRELFYRNRFADPPQMMVVDMPNPSNPGKPRMLFEDPYLLLSGRANYDVAEDGRFLMIQTEQPPPVTSLKVILNWFEELKERVPVR